MKVFDEGSGWGDRVNFVDKNNVLVGFDMGSSCCESFGYKFTRELPKDTDETSIEFEHDLYSFDPGFMESPQMKDLDGGGSISFKLVNDNNPEDVIFLTLYNSHNGYYSHGFDVKVGGKTIHEGAL